VGSAQGDDDRGEDEGSAEPANHALAPGFALSWADPRLLVVARKAMG
jgi:hypothetical protein